MIPVCTLGNETRTAPSSTHVSFRGNFIFAAAVGFGLRCHFLPKRNLLYFEESDCTFFSCTFCRKSRLWCNYSQVIENLEDFSIKLTIFLYSILFLLHVFCHISCHRKIFFKTNIKDFQTPIKPTIWHLFRNDFISIQVSTSPARNSSWRNELGAAHWAFFYCFLETGKTMFAFIFIFSLRKKDRQTGQKHLIVEKLIIQKWTTIKFIDARG